MKDVRLLCLGLFSFTAAVLAGPGESPAAKERVVVVAGVPAKDMPAVGGELHEPFAVDMDKDGNLYIAEMEGNRVRKLDPQGRLTTIAGTGEKGNDGDGGPAVKARINGMHHLAVGSDGALLLADTWNNRVRRLDLATGIVTPLAGCGVKGFDGDGGPAARAQCGGIYCLAVEPGGKRLFFADLDNRRIRVVTLSDGCIATLAGNGKSGVPTDGSPAAENPLVDPRAVACDDKGNVYILERSGHALRVVDSQGKIRTVAGTGKKGPAKEDVPALEATFNGPKHLCIDRAGDVLIADTENHVIRKFLVKANRVVLIAGTGKMGGGGVGGSPRQVELSRPHGVFVDGKGTMYIADSGNNRVLKVANPPVEK